MARVLGAIRQSKTRDRAVSPEAQRDAITRWAAANGHTVVKFTEDLSRSGGVSAFKRPGLGPWLTDEAHVAAWDVLVTTKLDRACRDARDFLRLRDWCADHGKTYVSLAENLDMTSAAGRMFATVTAAFAEAERERASERVQETRAAMQEQGRWTGGRVSYGYRADKTDAGYYVVPDEHGTADVARTMARMAIAGQSNGQIARWLNSEGHRTAIGREWKPATVRLVLRSAAMKGLLGAQEHVQLRAALRAREQTKLGRVGAHMLLRVAYCLNDDSPLYGAHRQGKGRNSYYRCLKCGTVFNMARLEDQAEETLLFLMGDEPTYRKQVTPGDTRAEDIARAEEELQVLRGMTSTPALDAVITEREAFIAHLRSQPFVPDRIEWVPTGETVTDRWDRLTTNEERNAFLRACRIRVVAWINKEFGVSEIDLHATERGIIQATREL